MSDEEHHEHENVVSESTASTENQVSDEEEFASPHATATEDDSNNSQVEVTKDIDQNSADPSVEPVRISVSPELGSSADNKALDLNADATHVGISDPTAHGAGNDSETEIAHEGVPPPLPSREPPPLPPRRRAPFFWLKGKSSVSLRSVSSDDINSRRGFSYTSPDYDLILQRIDATNEGLASQGSAEKDAALIGRRQLQQSFEEFKEDWSKVDHDEPSYDEEADAAIDWEFWSSVVGDYATVARNHPTELSQAIASGFPTQLRGLIWQLIASSKSSTLETVFNQIIEEPSPQEKAIKRDLARTSFTKSIKQESLFRIIKGYSLFDPEVGYTQGMAFITVPLLINMSEPEAFCLLVHLMKDYGFRDMFSPEMPGLHLKLYQFDRILEDTLPAVHIHLSRQGVRSSMYASQWFLTLFAYKFPLPIVLRIFDIVISEGLEAILRFGVALMRRNESQILSQDFESLLVFLKDHIFDYYRIEAVGKEEPQYRVKDLVQDSFNVKLLPVTLQKYSNEYTEIHRIEQERVEEVESLRSNNGHLSLQVRRLEEQLAALNSEHIQIANEMVQGKLEVARLQDENELLQNEVHAYKQANENYETAQNTPEEGLRDQNRELLETKSRLESQLDNLEKEMVETRMNYDRMTDDYNALKVKWDNLLKHIQG